MQRAQRSQVADTSAATRSSWLPAIPSELADRQRVFNPTPPSATPLDLFPAICTNPCCDIVSTRFSRGGDTRGAQILIFLDGACSNNGAGGVARGGSAAVFGPRSSKEAWAIYYPLPLDGAAHTSNRAELNAAIIVLSAEHWHNDGHEKLVLATDSQYLVLGISQYIHVWRRNGWRTSRGEPVKNRDLWETIYDKLRELESLGFLVQFWLIPRHLNHEADRLAKSGAVSKAPSYTVISSANMIFAGLA